MTRKPVDNSVQQSQPHEDHFLGQWACSLSVIIFLIAFGLSGQILPRFVANQCTSEQGMCTPGDCTCPFPLMKRDLVTQDAQACSQCVEEFCPAVVEGDTACSTAACECEDPSWPRIDVGSSDKPCMQCVHPHADVTLRREEDGQCLALGEIKTCTVFRYNGAVMLDKSSNQSSCLSWSNGDWQLIPCQGTPDSSAKFTRRGRLEASTMGTFCTSRGKQCLNIKEYMCTTDPSQCSTEPCRCEDSSHVRKEMQTVNRSTCYLCTPSLPECPLSPAACSSEHCECKPGFVKARHRNDALCFSCQPSVAPSITGLTSFLTFLSAGATFLLCVGLGVVVGCAIRRFIVGDPTPRRKRRGSQGRTWSENCAVYLEEAIQVVSARVGGWKPLKRVSWAVKKIVSFLDACDAALDPVYVVLEAGLDKVQHFMNVNIDKAKKLLGQADSTKPAKPKDGRQGHRDGTSGKEQFLSRAASQNDKEAGNEQSLSWDPINMNVGNEEWMNYVVPSLSAQRQSARHSRDALPPTSAVQRLRQRREAKAQAAAEKVTAQAAVAEVEVDESWIDAMEQKEAKEKEAKEKAAAQRRERKQAAKARRAKVAAGVSPDADHDEAEDVQDSAESKLQGMKEQADLFFSEAIHGMFLLATSDAREVEPEKIEVGSVDSEIPAKTEKVIFQSHSKLPRDALVSAEQTDDTVFSSQGEDGWTKSVSSRSRGGKRKGEEQVFLGANDGQMPSEQEPAEEPDPQEDPEEAPEVPEAPEAAEASLSKRQRQRLRQRQPKVGSGATKPATKAEKAEKAEKVEKAEAFPKSSSGTSESLRLTNSKDEKPVAPASSDRTKLEIEAEPVEQREQLEQNEPEVDPESGKSEESKALVRNFADIVAGRPARSPEEVEAAAAAAFSSFKADAPDFVPMSMTTQFQAMVASSYALIMDPVVPSKKGRRRRGRKEAEESQSLPLTTVVIGDISEEHDAQSLRLQMDGWGLAYNFFYMPPERQEEYGHCAVVNFVDPGFVMMCQQLFQQAGEATVTFFPIQGLENNVAYWTSFGVAEDLINGPLVFPAAAAQWSSDPNAMLNSKFSPQIKEQFHKTKLCVFNKKQKCSMGAQCPFAHSEEELQKAPDLTKTKLCYNFFRRKCNDANCKFAHGYGELRATDTVFKTELCRWWANGSCKAGASCRYAHGVEELRSNPNFTGMFGADFDLSEAADFGFGFGMYPYSLEEMQMAEMAEDDVETAHFTEDGNQFGLQELERSLTGSDGEMSEASTSVVGVNRLQRQQTAPPGVAASDDDIILRIKGTFMEAVRIDEELPQVSMRRSWSDGDLAQLCEALDSDSD